MAWVIVFFDLPVDTPEARKTAADFRKNLIRDGYFMVQFSVYARRVAAPIVWTHKSAASSSPVRNGDECSSYRVRKGSPPKTCRNKCSSFRKRTALSEVSAVLTSFRRIAAAILSGVGTLRCVPE
jgi:hypothetical protein